MDSTAQFFKTLREFGLDLETTFLPEALRTVTETLMDIDVSRMIDAAHYERNDTRVAYRNGYRQRMWKTPVGKVRLSIPKLRSGTYTPEFVDANTAQHLLEVIRRSVIGGVDAREIDNALCDAGLGRYSTNEISRLQETLDDLLEDLHSTPINQPFPYVWLETLPINTIQRGRSVTQIAAIALGVTEEGEAQLLGFEIGSSANDVFFWRLFLQNLVERGLKDVRLVVSDDFRGVKAAVKDILNADWHYHRAYALKRVLEDVPEADHAEVISAIATVFLQSSYVAASARLDSVIRSLHGRFPSAMMTLNSVADDVLVSMQYPAVETLLRVKQALNNQTDAIALVIDNLISDAPPVDAVAIYTGGDFRYEHDFVNFSF